MGFKTLPVIALTYYSHFISQCSENFVDCSSISIFTDEFMHLIFFFGLLRTLMFSVLTIAEMLIFKIFYMHRYSWIAGVNENFLTNFVTFFNMIIVFGFYMIRICLEEHVRTRFYYQNYAKPYEAYMKVHFP